MTRLSLSSLIVLALWVAACGGDDHDHMHPVDAAAASDGSAADAAPAQIVTEQKTLAPGEIIEATLISGPDDRADLHFTSSPAELDWNIHGHAGGGTQTVAEGFNQTQVDYSFTPSAQADWYLLLRNSGGAPLTVDVRIELYGSIPWGGWE
jgi:hypothetical protein